MKHKSIIVISLIFISLNLIGLDRSSVVWIDEVTINDPAKELAINGTLRSSVFAGEAGFEHVFLWLPPLHPIIIAVVYKIFGFGIWQTRIPVVLFGGLSLIVIYFIATNLLKDKKAALIGVLLFALNPQFIHTTRSGRMDTLCILLSALAIICYLLSEERLKYPNLLIALSGMFVGLASMTHPLAILWFITIGIIILIYRHGERIKFILLFGIFASILPLIWLIFALQTPDYFQAQFLSIVKDHSTEGSILLRVSDELVRYFNIYKFSPLLLLSYCAAIIWILFTKQINNIHKSKLNLLFFIPFLFNAIFMTKSGGSGFYILHPLIILSILTGSMISSSLFEANLNKNMFRLILIRSFVVLLFLNILVSGILGRYAALIYQWHERDYTQIENAVLANISKGSIVWGAPEIWYAAEKAGAHLRILGTPNPLVNNYIVVRYEMMRKSSYDYILITKIGNPFPKIFGKFTLPTADYQLYLMKSKFFDH